MDVTIRYTVTERLRRIRSLNGKGSAMYIAESVPEELHPEVRQALEELVARGPLPKDWITWHEGNAGDCSVTLMIPERFDTDPVIRATGIKNDYRARAWTVSRMMRERYLPRVRTDAAVDQLVDRILADRTAYVILDGSRKEEQELMDSDDPRHLFEVWRDGADRASREFRNCADRINRALLLKLFAEADADVEQDNRKCEAYNADRDREAAEQAEKKRDAERQAEAAEQRKKLYREEKLRWAKASGSEYLVKLLEQGYTANSLYLRERAALEVPGFVPVPTEDAENLKRILRKAAQPPEELLDLAIELKGQGHAATVVKAVFPEDYGDAYSERFRSLVNRLTDSSYYGIRIDDWTVPGSDGPVILYREW